LQRIILGDMNAQQDASSAENSVPDSAFSGFTAWAFEWFAGLERDNSREYFNSTRERYLVEVRHALTSMLEALSGTFGGTVRVFRQQNDMRFAPSLPYKTRTYGAIDFVSPERARLYADVSVRGLYAGTGYHRLAADQLARYRAAVVDDHLGARLAEAVALAQDAGLELIGDSLASAPRGFPRDHPRDELLRSRSLLVGRLKTGESGISRDEALEHVAGTWRAAAAVTGWLDAHVGASTVAPRERWTRRPSETPASTG
jgi:uncharacterized protein (DUF2461 family)